jgi:hypothetical protein
VIKPQIERGFDFRRLLSNPARDEPAAMTWRAIGARSEGA